MMGRKALANATNENTLMSMAVLEALAAGVVVWPAQLVTAGEGDRVHQHVDLPEILACRLGDGGDVIVLRDVAFFDPFAVDLFGQRPDAALERLACVADANPGALAVHGLRDAPGDRALICQSKDQCGLSFQQTHDSS